MVKDGEEWHGLLQDELEKFGLNFSRLANCDVVPFIQNFLKNGIATFWICLLILIFKITFNEVETSFVIVGLVSQIPIKETFF